jgi:Zn-dependent peptidase ImmA (M78 family)
MQEEYRKTTGREAATLSGGIFVKNNRSYIIHNPTHSPARQQSDLMHEITHEICGHELKELQTVLQGCVIPLRNYDQKQELEAECLGACLQLPKEAIFHYFCIKKNTPEQISRIFTASKQMVDYRLRISGVLKIKF